jgi:GMP synthase-like glutamine amidotransferase
LSEACEELAADVPIIGAGPAGHLLVGSAAFPAFHCMGTFDLPEGATLLGSGAQYPHQAVRFGSCANGLRFHIDHRFRYLVGLGKNTCQLI